MLALSLVLLLGLRSDPEPFVLDWQAPASCPSAGEVEARIDELLATRSPTRTLVVHASLVQTEAGFTAELSLQAGDDPPGVRTLGDLDCRELAEGVALIVALAVDSELASAEPDGEATDSPPSAEVRTPGPEVIRDPEPEPEPVPGRRLSLAGYALAGAGLRVLPSAAARLAAGVVVAGDPWRIELGLSAWLPRRIADARYQAWSVELAGCGVPRVGIVEFPVCARIEVGAMIGESLGPNGRRAAAPWLAATPGVGMIVRPKVSRGMLGLTVRADAVLPLTRPAFATDEGALLLRIDFGAQILAGLELRLPASARGRERTRGPKSSRVLGRPANGHWGMMPRSAGK